jgi:predicted O-methyltransferase YrrM
LRDDIIKLTSDDYFTGLQPNVKFDIIFIDGLHHSVQVLRDVKNSLVHLNTGGTIVCHDMLPENEDMQKVPMPDSQKHAWTGDCWKAWAYLRMVEPNLDMLVLNADFGVGIIQVGTQEIFEPFVKMENLEYDFLQSHKHKLLNVKNLKEVIEFS